MFIWLRFSILGTITFVQEENKPWSDTSVMVEVVNNLQQETLSHGWHIHKYPVGEDHLAEQKRCVSTGGHWNPFGAIIGGMCFVLPMRNYIYI